MGPANPRTANREPRKRSQVWRVDAASSALHQYLTGGQEVSLHDCH